MLTKSNYFNLINAANIASGLFENRYVNSIEKFEKFKNIDLGLPMLLQADRDVFNFSEDNTFTIPENSLLETIYNLTDRNYVGFKHSFKTNKFLRNFTIQEKHKKLFQSIVTQNSETLDTINKLRKIWRRVGAFQTRNIPHSGHEKIIQTMLLDCDHLVINPVIGPKKIGDVNIDSLRMIYNFLIKYKYGDRVSFQPIFANMFYAGPREAVHHALLRKRLGFDLFSVGRDHAGAEGVYPPEAAPNLVTELKDTIGIDVMAHQGAAFCTSCNEVIIIGECQHDSGSLQDIAGTSFRKCLRETRLFELADKKMLEYIYNSKMELFEK
tara:strand:+ start:711 stop:1685 length:975 start_codon:yes stop_codon:yes gene_type:complete